MTSAKPSSPCGEHVEVADPGTSNDARLATEEEHQLTVTKGLRKYWKACLWSMVISLTIIMDGYDQALLGSLSAFPSFRARFGHHVNEGAGFQISAHWQLALGSSTSVGNILGIYLGGFTTDRFGYKRSVIIWLVWLTGAIFLSFFATDIALIFVGELLSGMAWGVFVIIAPPYAAEVCPAVLRGVLEVWIVTCWGLGQLLSASVLYTLNSETSNWGWRIPFGVQWIWPAIILPLVWMAPESPWWLVRKGEVQEAEKVVQRLADKDVADEDLHRSVMLMVETNRMEKSMHEGVGYADCFKGSNLWRTEIACVGWASSLWCGFVIAAFATYFFELAGLQPNEAYKMSVGQGGLHILMNIISIPIVARVGRRRLFLVGFTFMCMTMFVLGFLALAPETAAVGFASSAVYLVWNCGYQLTVGPAGYILVSEVSSTRLRPKTVALARIAYNLSVLIGYFVGPYILNPGEANWKGKTGFLTGGINIVLFTWAWFRLPETKDRTFAELDILFAKQGLKARQFKGQQVDFVGYSGGKELP